jgi:hypothetical protein
MVLNTYDLFGAPSGLPIGTEYILKDPRGILTCWIKVCYNSAGLRDEVYHRMDGPARIHILGSQRWWVTGIEAVTFQHFQEMTGCSDEAIIMFKLKYGDMK